MAIDVRRIDPLTMGPELKRLFVENERPEFPEWFDRAYPLAVRDGASSWVTLDPDGGVIAHVAGFRATASVRGKDVPGALLCNLMADKSHRGFFPVVAAVKRAVKELRADGAEFIYTNPINPGSIAVMRAAGLREIGAQNRFMYPVGHRFLPPDLLLGTYVRARQIVSGGVGIEQVDIDDAIRWTVSERCQVSDVTMHRRPDVYYMRWGELVPGEVLGFLIEERKGRDIGAAIVGYTGEKVAVLTTLRCRRLGHVAPSAAAVASRMRRLGLHRLNAVTLQNTPFARELSRGGFIQRHDPWTIVAAGYTDDGRAVAEGLRDSDLEKIDVD